MTTAITKGLATPVANRDFVVCQVCGAQGLDLRKHIRRHRMDEATYCARYPDSPLIAETLRALSEASEDCRQARAKGLEPIAAILPDAIAGLVGDEPV